MKAQVIQLNNNNSLSHILNACRTVLNAFVTAKKQRIEVEIRNAKSQRSIKQNSLIHAIFNDISVNSTHVGDGEYYSPATWKAYFKKHYLQGERKEINGEVVYIPKSTAKLTKKECGEFVSCIIRFCHENEIELNLTADDYQYLKGEK